MFTQIENPFGSIQILQNKSFETESNFNWKKFIIFFILIFIAGIGLSSLLIHNKKKELKLIVEENVEQSDNESDT